jgi:hypothetical protein
MCGSGGCLPASEAFLQSLRDATRETGALLIFDEVMTSRLSPEGLHGLLGITPDLLTLGKYLGGGLSFGAFGGRADILDRFDPRRPDGWPHAGTFNNNVFTMSAGLAGLTHKYTPERAVMLNAAGDSLRGRLNDAIARRGLPMVVAGRGSMMAVHPGTTVPLSPPEAGKRPRSSMSPTLVLDGTATAIATGGQGGSRIITSVLQYLVNTLDHGMNLAEATLAPRIHHQWLPDELRVEEGFSPDTVALLEAMGHRVAVRRSGATVQNVRRVPEGYRGFADPRRSGGLAAGPD